MQTFARIELTLSCRGPLSYRNQSINLLCKSMDWFLYDDGLRHERVNILHRKKLQHLHFYNESSPKQSKIKTNLFRLLMSTLQNIFLEARKI